MTITSLIQGLALLVVLLLAAGLLGNLGPVEVLIWLGLVLAWIVWWVTHRGRTKAPS